MSELDFLNAQLAVAEHDDPVMKEHADAMACLDTEQKIAFLRHIYTQIQRLDEFVSERVMASAVSPDSVGDLRQPLIELLRRFQQSANHRLSQAQEHVRKGYVVPGMAELRRISENPSEGLLSFQAAITSQSRGNAYPETSFGEETYSALERLGASHPDTDDEDE